MAFLCLGAAAVVLYDSGVYTYLYSSIGIVNQDIKPAILFAFDPLKQLLDVLVLSGITDNWHTVSTPLLDLR